MGRLDGPNRTCRQMSICKSSNGPLSSFDVAITAASFRDRGLVPWASLLSLYRRCLRNNGFDELASMIGDVLKRFWTTGEDR